MTTFVGNTITLPKLASAPASPVSGDAYYDTTANTAYVYNGTSWLNLAASGGNAVYYQTTQPTGGTYAVGDIWVDSDSVLGGPISLTDSISSTSTTTAATPKNVKTTYDIATAGWEAFTFGTAGIIATHPRFVLTASTNLTSGNIVHSRIVPHRDFTVSNISFVSFAAATSATLIRFGIYTRSGTTFTLVARTASDTTIMSANNTKYTRALDTTGGYPATYSMTAGTEYWISVIVVATSSGSLLAATARTASAANAATAGAFYSQSGQSDLVTSGTGAVSSTLGGLYAEVS